MHLRELNHNGVFLESKEENISCPEPPSSGRELYISLSSVSTRTQTLSPSPSGAAVWDLGCL